MLSEWFVRDLENIMKRVVLLFASEGGASLRGAREIAQDLTAFLAQQARHPFGGALDGIAAIRMLQPFALQLVGRFETSQSQHAKSEVARQLAQSLELVPTPFEPAQQVHANQVEATEHIVAELVVEIESQSTRDALAKLRSEDTLEKHIRAVEPANGAKCARVPLRIVIALDPLVTVVDTQQALKVANATRENAPVFGTVSFSARDGALAFAPTVPFERNTKYAIKLRCDAVQTCLGSALRGVVRFRFSTA